jgi:hypothetical protein
MSSSRYAFKKTYAAGAFNPTALTALYALIVEAIENAEFDTLTSATQTEFWPKGYASLPVGDDVPHWAVEIAGGNIWFWTIYGANIADPTKRYANGIFIQPNPTYFNSTTSQTVNSTYDLWVIADGIDGFFTIVSRLQEYDTDAEAVYLKIDTGTTILTSIRRVAADMTVGLSARYGMYDGDAFYVPYRIYGKDGGVEAGLPGLAASVDMWSPVWQSGIMGMSKHAGSTLGDLMMPIYGHSGSQGGYYSLAVYGEIEHIMATTPGSFACEEICAPGWVAFGPSGSSTDKGGPSFAFPAPSLWNTP